MLNQEKSLESIVNLLLWLRQSWKQFLCLMLIKRIISSEIQVYPALTLHLTCTVLLDLHL
jgi:hypothetical protein